MRGGTPVPLERALQSSLVQSLPWVPVTLIVIAMALRFPLSRETWRHYLAIHLLAVPIVSFIANVLVVLGFWITMGQFSGFGALVQQGITWATIQLHVALLIYGMVVAMTQGVVYYRETRARELQLARMEGQLARAQLQVLTAQIRPHFLFNTLHTIGQLWRSGRSDDADAMLDHLGSLFHKVQHSTSRPEVPLAEELELVRDYLKIEQARFRDRLRTSVQASPESLGALVPPLILQPLVENAIRHGISAAATAGCVDVRALVEDSRLRLTVRDDGPGVNARPLQPGSGTGLRNTRERLAQLYGNAAELDINGGSGGGTVVTLAIPLVREPQGESDVGPAHP
ncbi:MAG TPA: histidine kinase [Gemmatimonadaceae bacterium]|nr:histidine kinase [Gemmatimonadaceae bacterium]